MRKPDSLGMVGIAAATLLLGACAEQPEEMATDVERAGEQAGEQVTMARQAIATLEPKSGSSLSGEAFFVEQESGDISFGVHVRGVSPGRHAVHIHETGDCSAPDASSAGGHWNPTDVEHGQWGEPPHHLGDIGNIEVGEDGDGSLSLTTAAWSLEETGERTVLGKAVVVHAGEDDFTTQPAGAAGERIACGVVTWAPDEQEQAEPQQGEQPETT